MNNFDTSKFPHFPNDVKVDSLREALELAESWRANGECDWFRGQTEPWPLVPTILRLKNENYPKVMKELDRYFQWSSKTPILEPISKDFQSLMGVAQHYGLPTHLLDFSTEPEIAGFFATHGENMQLGQIACIIAIHSTNTIPAWLQNTSNKFRLDTIRVHIPDLWRLQAQRGVFLLVSDVGLEQVLAPRRILFPFEQQVEQPLPEQIYPKQKSKLEELLDQYFQNERLLAYGVRHKQWIKEMKERGNPVSEAKMRGPCGTDSPYLDQNQLAQLERWSAKTLNRWNILPDEKWDNVHTEDTWEIKIDLTATPDSLAQMVREQVLALSPPQVISRRKMLCRFKVTDIDGNLAGHQVEYLNTKAGRLWDGMRNLPYSDDQLAVAMGRTLSLSVFLDWEAYHGGQEWKGAFAPFAPDAIKIEMSAEVSYSQAIVDQSVLSAAFRNNIADFFLTEHREQVGDPHVLLQMTTSPEILFQFNDLVELFAWDIIPAQIIMRLAKDPIYFNPASIKVFGLA